MFDSFAQLSALTVFLLIAGAGFLFLVLAFFLGDLLEAFDLDIHIGSGDAHEGVGIFDVRMLSILVTAFGCVGAFGIQLGLSTTLSAILGLLSGFGLGAAVYYFGKFLHRQQASSSVSAYDLLGRLAEVTVTIPVGNVGRVTCRLGEERIDKIARSRDGGEIPLGTTVRIEEIADEAVIVSREDRLYLSTN
jgi:membrane protein implicated in regulation of membrane protease activity